MHLHFFFFILETVSSHVHAVFNFPCYTLCLQGLPSVAGPQRSPFSGYLGNQLLSRMAPTTPATLELSDGVAKQKYAGALDRAASCMRKAHVDDTVTRREKLGSLGSATASFLPSGSPEHGP